MKSKHISTYIALTIACFAVFFGAGSAEAAWSDPTDNPTAGNVDAPINVGSVTQTKAGVMNAYGLRSYLDGVFDGNAYATAFYYSSDRGLKEDISSLSGSLSKILSLEGVSFSWKKDGKKSIGLIAQDVEKVYPEIVSTNPESGLKSLEYGNLVAPLIEAIKEQQRQIDSLKREVEALKAQI